MMNRTLAGLALVVVVAISASGCQEPSQPSEICEGFNIDQENMLRASVEKAQDDGYTFEETLNQLRSFCPEGSQDCDRCVTALAEEVFGETETP